MTNLRFLSVLALVLMGLLPPVAADAPQARIAVAGDPSLANLVDVTTATLSENHDLVVLDRADLASLGREQALQSVMSGNDFSPIQPLPAEGLVLLHSTTSNGKGGVFARLVAVQPGVVLREVALPNSEDPSVLAQALEKEFAPYWPKLLSLKTGKITALSLLGLRFEVDAPSQRNLEREFNILLASRLSAEPDALVLERWRLNDAVFEKSLSAQPSSPFWTGSSLIDGSMKWDGANDLLNVTLRMRPPHGPEVSIHDSDSADHLPELVERLAAKISLEPTTPVKWTPTDEAAHFTELARWCLNNRLFDEGAEAIESALALGDRSRTAHMLQVKAYAMKAFPNDLESQGVNNYRYAHLAPDSLSERVVAATEASRLLRAYLKANENFSDPKWNLEDPLDLGVRSLHSCLEVLRAAYDNGVHLRHPDEMAELRHEVRGAIDELGTKLLPQPPSQMRGEFLNDRAYYAGLWHDNPEETLAFYGEILRKDDGIDGPWIRERIFPVAHWREPRVDTDAKPGPYDGPKLEAPWIIAWDNRSPVEMTALWRNFIEELAASPNPVRQCDALKCELSSCQTAAGRSAVLPRFLSFLEKHTDSLSGPLANEFIAGNNSVTYQFEEQQNKALEDELFNLYLSLFQKHTPLAAAWLDKMSNIPWAPNSSATNPKLLAVLDDYETWYETQKPRDNRIMDALNRIRDNIFQADPELDPATKMTPTAGFLSVNHFLKIPARIDILAHVSAENHLWSLTADYPRKVIYLDPGSGQITSTFPIPAEFQPVPPAQPKMRRALEVSPQWLIVALDGKVLVCSRADQQWRALDVPVSSYKPRWVSQQLYLLYDVRWGDRLNTFNSTDTASMGSGLIRVSLPDGACENLISSRRTPPQNILDGHPLGRPLNLWSSTNGLNLAFEDLPIYASPIGKNEWTPLTNIPTRQKLRVVTDGALLETNSTAEIFGQLELLTGSESRMLLSDPASQTPEMKKPVWNFPKGLDGHNFPQQIVTVSPIMRGDDLCFYYKFKPGASGGNQDSLYYFAKGQKDGIKIPLAFDFQQMGKDPSNRQETPMILQYDSMQATDYGLALAERTQGFWLIPWSDIDAYRARITGTK